MHHHADLLQDFHHQCFLGLLAVFVYKWTTAICMLPEAAAYRQHHGADQHSSTYKERTCWTSREAVMHTRDRILVLATVPPSNPLARLGVIWQRC